MSINSVCVSGNLGRDPETRRANSGTAIVSFSVAVNDRVKSGDEWKDHTNWVDVTMFGTRAERLSGILHKGMKVTVSGKLRYSSWERDGKKNSKLEVIADDVDFMAPKQGSGQGQQAGGYAYGSGNAPQNAPQQPQGGYQQPQQQYQQQAQPMPQQAPVSQGFDASDIYADDSIPF